MRRRTKPKVVWLPNTNANSLGAIPSSTAQHFFVDVAGLQGDFSVGEIPLVIDSMQDPIGAEDVSLADIFDSGYRLRRIVGKVWIACQQQVENTASTFIATAGIIVRRADNTGTSLALQVGNAFNIAPSETENASDPWVWRRAWILRNNLATNGASLLRYANFPANNASPGYGSAVDGPHVDVKTGRIISQEERLFLDVSITVLQADAQVDPQIQTSFDVVADLRCLATMRSSVGNRRNASR